MCEKEHSARRVRSLDPTQLNIACQRPPWSSKYSINTGVLTVATLSRTLLPFVPRKPSLTLPPTQVIDIQSAVLSDEEVIKQCLEIRARNEKNNDFTFAREIRKEDGSKVRRLDGKLRELNWITGDVCRLPSPSIASLQLRAEEIGRGGMQRATARGMLMREQIIKHFSNQDSPLSDIAKEAKQLKPQRQRREANGDAVDGEEAPSQTKQLFIRLKPFGLTKCVPSAPLRTLAMFITMQQKRVQTQRLELMKGRSELLMLTNHRPRGEAVLDVLIEECETRFDGEQQAVILKVVREVYGLPDPEAEEEEQATEGAMEGVEKG